MRSVRPSMLRLAILLVDRNDTHRANLAHALRVHHDVATAPALHGAMRLMVSASSFDVVLCAHPLGEDHNLPVLHLVSVLRPEIVRCVMTAANDPALADGVRVGLVQGAVARFPSLDDVLDVLPKMRGRR